MSFLFHRFQFCAVLFTVPHSVAKQAWPMLSGGGKGRRLPPPTEGPVLAHSTVHVWMSIRRKEQGHLVWPVQTGRGDCHSCFLFCEASSFSWSFSFVHFERALVIMSDALPLSTVSVRDIMFILSWFRVACRASSSNSPRSPVRET